MFADDGVEDAIEVVGLSHGVLVCAGYIVRHWFFIVSVEEGFRFALLQAVLAAFLHFDASCPIALEFFQGAVYGAAQHDTTHQHAKDILFTIVNDRFGDVVVVNTKVLLNVLPLCLCHRRIFAI